MTESEDEPLGFDIGIGGAHSRFHRVSGARNRPTRRIPVWGLAALAAIAGLIIGALLGSSQREPLADEAAPSATAEAAPLATALPPTPTPTSAPPALPTPLPLSLAGETIVVAELSGADRLPSSITLFDSDGSRDVLVQGRIAGPTQAAVGHVDRRVVVVDHWVVFVADRSAMLIDLRLEAAPIRLTDAVRLMPYQGTGYVWVLGTDPQQIALADLRGGEPQVFDLTEVGEPLASYQGGLAVAPVDDRLGPIALWSPARGIEEILLDATSTLIDASGPILVIHTEQGVATYNSVTGELFQTDRQLTTRQQTRAFVSPDGSRLAIVERETIVDQPTVRILDLATGETIDEFPSASEWLLHWVSDEEVLHISPTDESKVQLRHVGQASTSALVDLQVPATWVTVAG